MENETRQHYLGIWLCTTGSGIKAQHWKPDLGFRIKCIGVEQGVSILQRIVILRNRKFLWACIAKVDWWTGAVRNEKYRKNSPWTLCLLTWEIVAVAKDIFESLAWQHELFLHDPDQLLSVCNNLERNKD